MNDKLRNHPLNGIGLEALLGDLVREYGWEVLASQVPIDCFKRYPSFKSSMKFLHKTEWARERLEDLYLYKFLQYPLPNTEQCAAPPRNRIIESERLSDKPAVINEVDAEFFACPAKPSLSRKRSRPNAPSIRPDNVNKESVERGNASDPWHKWRT